MSLRETTLKIACLLDFQRLLKRLLRRTSCPCGDGSGLIFHYDHVETCDCVGVIPEYEELGAGDA